MATVARWLGDPNIGRSTVSILKMEKPLVAADKADDVGIPKGLTSMNKYLDFELQIQNHLKNKIRSTGTSLLYILWPLLEEADVKDEHSNGRVGLLKTDDYTDWVDYTI